MTTIAFEDGKPVFRDGKVGTEQACCCDPCVNCECEVCVSASFVSKGLANGNLFPNQATIELIGNVRPSSCVTPEPCHEFESLATEDPGAGLPLGPGECGPDFAQQCNHDDFDYIWFTSLAGTPCLRIRCDEQGNYFLDVCIFNECRGIESGGARLTRKTYALALGESGCPVSVGEELSSSSIDFYNDGTGIYVTPPPPPFDLNGNLNNTPLCNQECWDQVPFDFVVRQVVDGICQENPLP